MGKQTFYRVHIEHPSFARTMCGREFDLVYIHITAEEYKKGTSRYMKRICQHCIKQM
jgi:hypothetical protein